MEENENGGGLNWRAKTFMFGGIVGALVGLGVAYIYVSSVKDDSQRPEIKPGALVAVGLTLLGLMRQVAALSEPEEDKKLGKKK